MKKNKQETKNISKKVESLIGVPVEKEQYLEACCYQYVENELNGNEMLMKFSLIIPLPEFYITDPSHQNFQQFMSKYADFVGGKYRLFFDPLDLLVFRFFLISRLSAKSHSSFTRESESCIFKSFLSR